ncbi:MULTISPECIES: hypothetical protein [Bacteroidaceae]|uniref:hypothetical protein n=1 Tax=Bacteroidaceae TaxID=815 RepID=UPI0013A62279|nr:hypothetical protein [Bacteroides ilei]
MADDGIRHEPSSVIGRSGSLYNLPLIYARVLAVLFISFLSFGSFWLLKQYAPGIWLISTDSTSSHPSSAVPGDFYIIPCIMCG